MSVDHFFYLFKETMKWNSKAIAWNVLYRCVDKLDAPFKADIMKIFDWLQWIVWINKKIIQRKDNLTSCWEGIHN